MQIAGEKCSICTQGILLESEATWCARCKTAVHHKCLTERQDICPVCAKPLERPEQHFYYSKYCAVCGARNTPPRSHCPNCGNATQWDSEDEYLTFRRHVMATSRKQISLGLVQMGFGLLLAVGYLVVLGLLLQSGRWFVSGAVFFAVIYLCGSGDEVLERLEYAEF